MILTLRTGSSYHLSCTTKQLTSGFESKDRAASDSCSHGLISHKQIISAVGNLSLVRLPPWSGAVNLSHKTVNYDAINNCMLFIIYSYCNHI